MKKLILISVLLFILGSALYSNAEWKSANKVSFAWDAPTTVPAGCFPIYKVYTREAIPISSPAFSQEVTGDILQATVTLPEDGFYYLGVSAICRQINEIDGTIVDIESEMAWSDNPSSVLDGNIFGVYKFPVSLPPAGLQLK